MWSAEYFVLWIFAMTHPRCVLPAKNTSENQRQILLYLWSVGGAQDDKQINKIVMGMEQGQRGNRDFIKSGEKRSRRERFGQGIWGRWRWTRCRDTEDNSKRGKTSFKKKKSLCQNRPQGWRSRKGVRAGRSRRENVWGSGFQGSCKHRTVRTWHCRDGIGSLTSGFDVYQLNVPPLKHLGSWCLGPTLTPEDPNSWMLKSLTKDGTVFAHSAIR